MRQKIPKRGHSDDQAQASQSYVRATEITEDNVQGKLRPVSLRDAQVVERRQEQAAVNKQSGYVAGLEDPLGQAGAVDHRIEGDCGSFGCLR